MSVQRSLSFCTPVLIFFYINVFVLRPLLTFLTWLILEDPSILVRVHLACGFASVCSPSEGHLVPQPTHGAVDPAAPGPVPESCRSLVPPLCPGCGAQTQSQRPTGWLCRSTPRVSAEAQQTEGTQVAAGSADDSLILLLPLSSLFTCRDSVLMLSCPSDPMSSFHPPRAWSHGMGSVFPGNVNESAGVGCREAQISRCGWQEPAAAGSVGWEDSPVSRRAWGRSVSKCTGEECQ